VANIKSQIKRIKTNEKARQRNKAVKSSLKTAVRKAREAMEAGDVEKATALTREANKKLDKAASKGVIHKNQAANKKSALAARVAGLQGSAFPVALDDHPPERTTRSLSTAPLRHRPAARPSTRAAAHSLAPHAACVRHAGAVQSGFSLWTR
jgi:small subunit ribosomal protein S20